MGEPAVPARISFTYPMGNTEGTVKCYVVNKQRNGMERLLAAPGPAAVEDNLCRSQRTGGAGRRTSWYFLALMESMLDKKMKAKCAGMEQSSGAGRPIGKVFVRNWCP